MRNRSPLDHYKKQATALQEYLSAGGTKLKRTHALEAIARIHGFDDFQTLSFVETRTASFTGVEDVTKYVRKNSGDFDLWDEEVVLALSSPDGLYAAIRSGDEIVAAYISERGLGEYKAYYEGVPFASHCPARILSLLSPTDDPSRLVWREAGWIHALRSRIEEMGDEYGSVCPWHLLSTGQEFGGYNARFAAHVAGKADIYAVCDGVSAKIVNLDRGWQGSAHYLSSSTENPLDSVEHRLRPGIPWRWIELGSAPFRVWVLVSRDGGFYSWTSNPFHFDSAMPGLMWTEISKDLEDRDARMPEDGNFFGHHDGTKAVLEAAARGPLNKGEATFDLLLDRVLAGQFDPRS